MLEIWEYLQAAKARNGLGSDYALARQLGVTRQAINEYQSGRALPKDATMLRLGVMSGVRPEQAVLDLARWRANRNGHYSAAQIVERIAHEIGANKTSEQIMYSIAKALANSERTNERVSEY